MVYDLAKVRRLAQPAPVDSTYVQLFDVNPATGTPDLPEAAYPGMLIFRNDLGILQIWDDEAGTWLNVAGGVPGQHTYVGPEFPTGTSFNLGDLYLDDDADYTAYVWNGVEWAPTSISASQVGSGTFANDINLGARLVSQYGPSGQHVVMGSSGLTVYTGSNEATDATTIFGSDGQSIFKGQAEISNLTVTSSTTLRQATQVTRSGVATLNAGVTAPSTAPSVVLDNASVNLTGYSFTGKTQLGLHWDSGSGHWRVPVVGPNASGYQEVRNEEFDASGVYQNVNGVYTFAGITTSVIKAAVKGDSPGTTYALMLAGTGLNQVMAYPDGGPALLPMPITVINTAAQFAMSMDPITADVVVAEFHLIASDPYVRLQRFNQVSGGINLVPNSDFEANITGWSGTNVTLSRTTSVSERIANTASLAVVTNSTDDGFFNNLSGKWAVTARKKYIFGVKCKAMSGTGTNTVSALFRNASNTPISGTVSLSNPTPGGGATVSWSGYVTAPADAASAYIEVSTPQTTGRYIFDDFFFNEADGLNFVSLSEVALISAQTCPVGGLYIGNGDFGAKQYVIASGTSSGNQALVCPTASGGEVVNTSFPLASVPKGIGYDGTSFWTLGQSNQIYKYESGNKFTTEPITWSAVTTYADTTHGPVWETTVSPPTPFTMKRRARLT